jgi:hypothetical protein
MSDAPRASESIPPESDRRGYTRFRIWFPITLVSGDREVWAICRDASSKGFLVSSMATLAVGTSLLVRFRVTRDGEDREASARVLRATTNVDDLQLAFPHRLAIEFDNAEPNLEERLREATR